MLTEGIRAQLCAVLEQYLASASACHQSDHTRRVVKTALVLAHHYPEVDSEALEVAAWLHDIGRGVERTNGVSHAVTSAMIAREMLPALGFSDDRTDLICAAIADHRYSAQRRPASLEGCLLQDADRLDALGAIGIARTFSESHDRLLFHPETPFGDQRALDDTRYALDHFFTKLLRLVDTLHTPEATVMAKRRIAFIHQYLHELADELGIAYYGEKG